MIGHHPDHPELVVFGRGGDKRGRENLYHSDVSWRELPSMGSMPRCVEGPEIGGDTIWVNMAAAYAALPEDVKARIAELRAVHDAMPTFGQSMDGERYDEMRAKYPPMVHPVVRTHPETGEKILYVNEGFTTHFANYARMQPYRIGSDFRMAEMDLMQYLFRQAAARVPGAVALARQHGGALGQPVHPALRRAGLLPAVRHMNRATIIGDRPA
jgi:taurine dioxygenase